MNLEYETTFLIFGEMRCKPAAYLVLSLIKLPWGWRVYARVLSHTFVPAGLLDSSVGLPAVSGALYK